MIRDVFLASAGLFWFCAAVILADTHYVRPPETCTNTTGQSPYTNWDTAATNIQWAVNDATGNDTVLVSNGVYSVGVGGRTAIPYFDGGWDWNATNFCTICLTNKITLRGINGPNVTVIDGNYPAITARCVVIFSNAVLDGFTVRNGYGGRRAGGIALARGDGDQLRCLWQLCQLGRRGNSLLGFERDYSKLHNILEHMLD